MPIHFWLSLAAFAWLLGCGLVLVACVTNNVEQTGHDKRRDAKPEVTDMPQHEAPPAVPAPSEYKPGPIPGRGLVPPPPPF